MNENKEETLQNSQEMSSKALENKNISISFGKKLFTILRDGIVAFSIILILLAFSKFLAFSTKSVSNFVITINDIVYSLWALVIVTSIEIMSYRKS